MSFDQLKQEYSTCTKCPALCQSRSQVVFGSGNPKAEVILIGEAPGANEDKQGIPFCGMSGQVLNELLNAVGLSREDIFITNTILCRPQDNRNPAKDEVENCRDRLDKLIQIMQPKVIVTIGNFATERILGKKGITSLRGKIFENAGRKIVPVIHPANYLYSGRNPEMFAQMKKDFETIASVITEKNKINKQKKLG
ncbi:MAG TPA: uracil-DNA glycosylase, partial [Candidatus Nanoarchaeia archaeon]|nr:uracil-DNA glycosylase [Candidatus Nanoarchaeia archaeon]